MLPGHPLADPKRRNSVHQHKEGQAYESIETKNMYATFPAGWAGARPGELNRAGAGGPGREGAGRLRGALGLSPRCGPGGRARSRAHTPRQPPHRRQHSAHSAWLWVSHGAGVVGSSDGAGPSSAGRPTAPTMGRKFFVGARPAARAARSSARVRRPS